MIRNPVVALDFTHRNAQLGVRFDELVDQISTIYNTRSYAVSFGRTRLINNKTRMRVIATSLSAEVKERLISQSINQSINRAFLEWSK